MALWAQIVTWVLVITGWLIVNYQNNRRESRKEIRQKLDALKKYSLEIETSAIEHHTTKQEHTRCLAIKRGLARISSDLRILVATGLTVSDPATKMARVRQAITYDNFETISYSPVATDSDLVESISLSFDELFDSLELAYSRHFTRPSLSFKNQFPWG